MDRLWLLVRPPQTDHQRNQSETANLFADPLDLTPWFLAPSSQSMFLLAAMGPPGGGRMVISKRLQSRFNLINMTFPQVCTRKPYIEEESLC